MKGFPEACVEAPLGATMLALIEWRHRPEHTRLVDDPTSNPAHVALAVDKVNTMSFGQLCEDVCEASWKVGPWTSGAEDEAWAAYAHVSDRLPIAQAIGARFEYELHAPVALEAQEWWLHSQGASAIAPLFVNLDRVYENGELSWGALRAYGPTPDEVLDEHFGEAPHPSTRWALPVVGNPRVFEIHRPQDWRDLCVRYPLTATQNHGSWALPGPNKGDLRRLNTLRTQHAATSAVDVHLCPKWSQVGRDYDAVHLSWAGFITTEGYVLTEGDTTTMLRYWDREVTMWLSDNFGEPRPLAPPFPCDALIDPTSSPERLAQDRKVIGAMLNRADGVPPSPT